MCDCSDGLRWLYSQYLFDVFAFEVLFTVVLVLSESEQLMLLLFLQFVQSLRVLLLQSSQLLVHSRQSVL